MNFNKIKNIILFMKFISNFDETALSIAIENENIDMIILLLSRDDLDINAKYLIIIYS